MTGKWLNHILDQLSRYLEPGSEAALRVLYDALTSDGLVSNDNSAGPGPATGTSPVRSSPIPTTRTTSLTVSIAEFTTRGPSPVTESRASPAARLVHEVGRGASNEVFEEAAAYDYDNELDAFDALASTPGQAPEPEFDPAHSPSPEPVNEPEDDNVVKYEVADDEAEYEIELEVRDEGYIANLEPDAGQALDICASGTCHLLDPAAAAAHITDIALGSVDVPNISNYQFTCVVDLLVRHGTEHSNPVVGAAVDLLCDVLEASKDDVHDKARRNGYRAVLKHVCGL